MSVIEDMARKARPRAFDVADPFYQYLEPARRDALAEAEVFLRAALSGPVGDVLRQVVEAKKQRDGLIGQGFKTPGEQFGTCGEYWRKRAHSLAEDAAAALPADILDMLRETKP